MADHKPSAVTQAAVLLSLLVPAVAGIALTGLGYMRWLEHGLGLDLSAKPRAQPEDALILGLLLLMIVLMAASVLVVGIPWMFIMSRVLPPEDLRYFTSLKGPRYPWISDAMDRLWLAMIRDRMR